VQTGSRNEVEPGKSGFAHFFEHMMFRGTEKYPADAYQALLTQAGARQNAYTTNDFTNYHTTFAKEDLEKMLEIEADRFRNLKYSVEDFKTEARAVLGEYNKNSASPIQKIFEVQRENAFTTHTYRHTTMGFLRDIEEMPNQFDYSKVFFDRWYRPEYTALIVAGDVDPAKVMPLVEKYWGGWKRGSYKAEVPLEPPPAGPKYAHVEWNAPTLPYVTVAFRIPAFSTTSKDYAAVSTLFTLEFGPTSALYKRLVEQEQKVDQLFASAPASQDPFLGTVFARVKNPADAVYVRDQIVETFARARVEPVAAKRLEEAKSNARYSFARTLDNTESIASTLARFVRYERSYSTLNDYYRTHATLTSEDLRKAAAKYFTDASLVVTTLSREPLPEGIAEMPSVEKSAVASASGDDILVIARRSQLPQLDVKLLFRVGSAHDPAGKEGLARLAASMITAAGSKDSPIAEIRQKLYPIAGSFSSQVDKEMTTFTAIVHRDNAAQMFDLALPMLLDPGFREEDFNRLRDSQKNSLVQDLRTNNEEELGKEHLIGNLFAGSRYAHPVLGTVAGLDAITLDDVKAFVRDHFTRANLVVGIAGDVPAALEKTLKSKLASLPAGTAASRVKVAAHQPKGIEVDIIEKETRATAISLGHPIAVTRAHPDFVALSVARAWLGEHRSSMSHLYQRIRETRGMNYGDYAYIEAFPNGGSQFFPSPNRARSNQIFEIWIRPVVPENAHFALRIAIHELEQLVKNGLTQEQFEAARGYLMKNVYLLTATQDDEIGYALDSDWYGTPEYTRYMRDALLKLTRAEVNAAVKKHFSPENLSVVMITKDAAGLKEKLVSDAFSPITYDAPKPQELLDEDQLIGSKKLGIAAAKVKITPVESVFAK
jgi:zinc protease